MSKNVSNKIENKEEVISSLAESVKNCFRELEEKDALCKEYLDHLIRLKAEFENYKKRVEKERGEYVRFANSQLILQILPVIDNLKLAIENAKFSKDIQILRGMEMVFKSLEEILIKNGLEKIETEGKTFDPHVHEAVEFVESEEIPENTIIEEIKEGYIFNNRVIRPAKVKISKRPNGTKKGLL